MNLTVFCFCDTIENQLFLSKGYEKIYQLENSIDFIRDKDGSKRGRIFALGFLRFSDHKVSKIPNQEGVMLKRIICSLGGRGKVVVKTGDGKEVCLATNPDFFDDFLLGAESTHQGGMAMQEVVQVS